MARNETLEEAPVYGFERADGKADRFEVFRPGPTGAEIVETNA